VRSLVRAAVVRAVKGARPQWMQIPLGNRIAPPGSNRSNSRGVVVIAPVRAYRSGTSRVCGSQLPHRDHTFARDRSAPLPSAGLLFIASWSAFSSLCPCCYSSAPNSLFARCATSRIWDRLRRLQSRIARGWRGYAAYIDLLPAAVGRCPDSACPISAVSNPSRATALIYSQG